MSAFRTRGSLDRRVNLSLRAPAQMGWRKMEHKGKARLVLSRTRGVSYALTCLAERCMSPVYMPTWLSERR
jgi:hypothetical protein